MPNALATLRTLQCACVTLGLALTTVMPATLATSTPPIALKPASLTTPLFEVSPAFISFALDNGYIRNPGVLPVDATNSTRIDFQNKLLIMVMPFVKDGYIRIGGTYTDFVHYEVPDTNYTRCPYAYNVTRKDCPGNSFPCCLPLPMSRWVEALEFANTTGLRITYNLNILQGRWEEYTHALKNGPHTPSQRGTWDSSNARALLEWTAKNVDPKLWPAAFGLGNELNWFLEPGQWAQDHTTLHAMLVEIFPDAATRPLLYGPCNAGLAATWSEQYLGNLSHMAANALHAFSYHGYSHPGNSVDNVAHMEGGIDASGEFYRSVQAMHQTSALANTKLWITETAYSASPPQGAEGGGAAAAIDGMCRAADIAWNLDALGSAAEAGVSVFCRETLAGDWLETISLWQPGSDTPYTPHPDFWVAALWRKLMSQKVLGVANNSATISELQKRSEVKIDTASDIKLDTASDMATKEEDDDWVIVNDSSSVFEAAGVNGSEDIPYYGLTDTWEQCRDKCAADSTSCDSFAWSGTHVDVVWRNRCFGRRENMWALTPVRGVVSGCDRSKGPCQPPLQVRTFAHCSALNAGRVVYAIAVAPCVRDRAVDFVVPGATSLTHYWLDTATNASSNSVRLNGVDIRVGVDVPLPSLTGVLTTGESISLPNNGVCTVGFVEAAYKTPVPACITPA